MAAQSIAKLEGDPNGRHNWQPSVVQNSQLEGIGFRPPRDHEIDKSGWQHEASSRIEQKHRESGFRVLAEPKKALLRSQGGSGAGAALKSCSTCPVERVLFGPSFDLGQGHVLLRPSSTQARSKAHVPLWPISRGQFLFSALLRHGRRAKLSLRQVCVFVCLWSGAREGAEREEKGDGPDADGPEGGGTQNFAFVFSSPAPKFNLFSHSGDLLVELWHWVDAMAQNSVGVSPIHLLARQVSLYSETRFRRMLRPYFSDFPRLLLVVHLEQIGLQKTFPDVPNEFRVPGCKQESRPMNPRNTCIVQRIHLVLQFLNFEPLADSM